LIIIYQLIDKYVFIDMHSIKEWLKLGDQQMIMGMIPFAAMFLGRGANTLMDISGLVQNAMAGRVGDFSDATQGIFGGDNNTVIGSLSEALTNALTGTLGAPAYMAFSIFRGLGEIFNGDKADGFMTMIGALLGMPKIKTLVDGLANKNTWGDAKDLIKQSLPDIGNDFGEAAGNGYRYFAEPLVSAFKSKAFVMTQSVSTNA
jgi:hypothetical protein